MKGERMKKILTALMFALFLEAFAAPPYVGYLYPASLQRGTTNRVVVGGQHFGGNVKFHALGKGIGLLMLKGSLVSYLLPVCSVVT
jgi:hypothetical protein